MNVSKSLDACIERAEGSEQQQLKVSKSLEACIAQREASGGSSLSSVPSRRELHCAQPAAPLRQHVQCSLPTQLSRDHTHWAHYSSVQQQLQTGALGATHLAAQVLVIHGHLPHLVHRRGGIDGRRQAASAYQVGQRSQVAEIGVGQQHCRSMDGWGNPRRVQHCCRAHQAGQRSQVAEVDSAKAALQPWHTLGTH